MEPDPDPGTEPEAYCWHLPCPSPRAERVLLTLFAMGAAAAHRVSRLTPMATAMGVDPAHLPEALAELRTLGYVGLSPRGRVARLTLAAAAHVGLLSSEVLAAEVAGEWSPADRAEALLILSPESYYAELLIH